MVKEIVEDAEPADERVWVPQGGQIWFRPLLLDTVTGVASPEPIPDLPGLPLVCDTVPGCAVIAWGVMLAPKGTPRPSSCAATKR